MDALLLITKGKIVGSDIGLVSYGFIAGDYDFIEEVEKIWREVIRLKSYVAKVIRLKSEI